MAVSIEHYFQQIFFLLMHIFSAIGSIEIYYLVAVIATVCSLSFSGGAGNKRSQENDGITTLLSHDDTERDKKTPKIIAAQKMSKTAQLLRKNMRQNN